MPRELRVIQAALFSVGFNLSSPAIASTTRLDVRYARDTLGVYHGRTELSWLSEQLGIHMLQLAAHGTLSGAAAVKGIAGGERAYGGADASWIFSVDALEVRLLGGLEDAAELDSWRADGRFTLAPKFLEGVSLSLGGSSRWMDGWFTYGIRSTAGRASVGFSGKRNWVEAGGIWDERSSPRMPATAQRLELRGNRIHSLYGWYSHAFADWLMLGITATYVDARIDYHQPVSTDAATGILQYSDYPYPTPHSEGSWSALSQLTWGQFQLKATWPVFSLGSYRVEDPYVTSPFFYYQSRYRAQAELSAKLDTKISDSWSLVVEAFAISRPYRTAAWFTNDAWNQFGLNLVLRYKSYQLEQK